MTTATITEQLERDTPLFARYCLKILPKDHTRGMIDLIPNEAQIELDRRLEEQRAAGKPQRAIVLKARRVGISTWIQAKLIQRSVYIRHHKALVVAHDVSTGEELFGMGRNMYRYLPEEIKPEVRSYRRTRFMHFGQKGEEWDAEIWPDSEYFVDTAGEFEAGRGTARHAMHWSEFAFWPQPEQKATALNEVMHRHPESLLVIESTANGMNAFKDRWDDAEDGRGDFFPFFWPWWKQRTPDGELEYALPFVNEAEREEFRIGDADQSPYAEEESELVDPGPVDTLTGEHVPLSLEQLNWRRWKIADLGGKIEKFHQEYPATPEQAFLSTGSKVFEPMLVARAIAQAEQTDPRVGEGGPLKGRIDAGGYKMVAGRHGKLEAPENPEWKPARLLAPGEDADWRLWLPEADGMPVIDPEAQFVVGVDVSEGLPESGEGEPAYQAIEVIDHRTKEQVAEYRSRCDPDLLAEHAVLTALLFNNAWLAIEKTGPGIFVVRKAWHDFHYTFCYMQRKHQQRGEGETDRLGWSTDRATKQLLIAGGQELLREGTHGIKSRRLAGEMQTYIRLSTGKMVPEKGRFSDLLMAWLVAQQVAIEKPIRKTISKDSVTRARPAYSAFRR